MSLLDVDKLSICYGDDFAVDSLSISIDANESVGLVGESGSGKTQTALAVLGLLPQSATVGGSIRFNDRELIGASEKQLNSVRARHIAMIFQDPMQALNPYVTIGQQLVRILLQHELIESASVTERVTQMLNRVGLPDPKRQYDAYPHQLSGGMRQRAMIASALLAEPELLIADEPTTALDVTVQAQILELLDRIRDKTALLLITHDLGIIAGHCERTLVVDNGKLVESGATISVFSGPQHERTKSLLDAAPRIDAASIPAPVSGKTILQVTEGSVSFELPGRVRLKAVRTTSLGIREAETIAVVGESGSGKSSLVRAALGLIQLDAGRVTFCGELLSADVRNRASKTRADLQMVFQDPAGSLDPQMRIQRIVSEPLLVHRRDLGRAERREHVAAMLDKVGLGADFLRRYPHELSGGQAQRVAIARALITTPKVLVCDEAVAALDGSVQQQILNLLREVQQETGLSIIFISHDLAVVRSISHRVLVMYLGRLVELADNAALFDTPQHPYTRALLDAVPVPDPRIARGMTVLAGEVPSPLKPPLGCSFHPRCTFANERCKTELPAARTIVGTTVACHRAEELHLHTGVNRV